MDILGLIIVCIAAILGLIFSSLGLFFGILIGAMLATVLFGVFFNGL